MEDLLFAATDSIPGIGALVSFTLGAVTAGTVDDPGKAVGYALEGFEDIVRDGFIALSFFSGQPELIPWIAVARDATAGLTQAGSKLLFEHLGPRHPVKLEDGTKFTLRREGNKLIAEPDPGSTITGEELQKKVLANLIKHHDENKSHKYGAVLMPHEDGKAIATLKKKLEEKKAQQKVRLYGAVFTAKLDYAVNSSKSKYYSKDDNLFLTFPTGLENGNQCLIFTTFDTAADKTEKKPILIIDPPMKVDTKDPTKVIFEVIPADDKSYGFRGEVDDKYQITKLTMLQGGREIKSDDVELTEIKSITRQGGNLT